MRSGKRDKKNSRRGRQGARPTTQKARAAAGRKRGRKGLSLMGSAEEPRRQYAAMADALKYYRPIKKPVTLRLDADVIAWFKREGRRYQTRINSALRKVMEREMQAEG